MDVVERMEDFMAIPWDFIMSSYLQMFEGTLGQEIEWGGPCSHFCHEISHL